MKTKSEGESENNELDPVVRAGLATAAFPGVFRRGGRGGHGEERELCGEGEGGEGTGAAGPGGSSAGEGSEEKRKRRSRRRLFGVKQEANCYHVMSRTAGGEMLFGRVEKEAFVRVMRRLEGFSGVEILTYTVMSNHFHLLVRVPDRETFLKQFEGDGGEERLLEQLALLYTKGYLAALRRELKDLREQGMMVVAEDLLECYKRRFCDLSLFVKELKERFSRWFNKQHGRKGTLWMACYKSVVVEDGEALRAMAFYIELNPVRAGLCDDPKDYRWCGYAEAVAGGKRARAGLCQVMGRTTGSWNEKTLESAKESLTGAEWYRLFLFERGMDLSEGGRGRSTRMRKGISAERVKEVLAKEGKLSLSELLRCRVRYFSDGAAIGSRGFVEELFVARRGNFGPKRKDGARLIREAPEAGLFSLRALRVKTVN